MGKSNEIKWLVCTSSCHVSIYYIFVAILRCIKSAIGYLQQVGTRTCISGTERDEQSDNSK